MTTDWRHQAACHGTDPELFFPVGTGGAAIYQASKAKEICRRCPVRDACLEWALDRREPDGVWGGKTEPQRRNILRRRREHAAREAAA